MTKMINNIDRIIKKQFLKTFLQMCGVHPVTLNEGKLKINLFVKLRFN